MTEPVVAWYRRRTAENEWRSLLRYGPKTHRARQRVRDLYNALAHLGEWLSGREPAT